MDLRPGLCTCGCGSQTTRLFAPGHNQLLLGYLQRDYRHARRVAVVQPLGSPQLLAAPEAAELLGTEWLARVAGDDITLNQHSLAVRGTAEAAIADLESEWGDL